MRTHTAPGLIYTERPTDKRPRHCLFSSISKATRIFLCRIWIEFAFACVGITAITGLGDESLRYVARDTQLAQCGSIHLTLTKSLLFATRLLTTTYAPFFFSFYVDDLVVWCCV